MKDIVTREQAIELMKIGFKESTDNFYHLNDDFPLQRINFNESANLLAAPTLYQVQQWFIKNKNIKIIPGYIKNNFYTCKIYWVDSQGFEQFTQCEEKPYVYNFESYEKALSIGIDFAIKLESTY